MHALHNNYDTVSSFMLEYLQRRETCGKAVMDRERVFNLSLQYFLRIHFALLKINEKGAGDLLSA
jgi:hypothetical protein